MDRKEPLALTACAAAAAIRAGTLTSEALVQSCLRRIKTRERDVEAWAHIDPERALAAARAFDGAPLQTRSSKPLAGIPVAIKDIIDTADYPTENGSSVFKGRQPDEDAGVVAQLKACGAIILGKTVTTELAFFGPGKTRNPRNAEHTPGGSSSGSAAAVADEQVPLALGTQTAGSIIRPASFCGTIGFKPTSGYVSRAGVLPQSAPLDTVGGYARSVEDIALLMDCVSAYDRRDGEMSSVPKSSLAEALGAALTRPPRFAFVKTAAWPLAEVETHLAFEAFAGRLGSKAEIVNTALSSDFDGSLRLQQIVQFSDIARNYGPIAAKHPDQVSTKLKDVIAEGRTFSVADYAAARAARDPLYDELRPLLVNYDAILTPAAPGPAPHGLASTGSPMFNALWTYLGMPCISLPLLKARGLPLGVQLVAARGDDAGLLRVANWLMEQMGSQA